jgi:predicted acetyltransferase
MTIDISLVGPSMHEALTAPLRTAFGMRLDTDRVARNLRTPELVQRIAATEDGKVVGSAGAFRFEMTTPGGLVPMSGLTMVGVLPTHRRRGILTRMMDLHIAEARANGLPISALWATEEAIYGRFGYGIASLQGSVTFDTQRMALKRPVGREGALRLLEAEEARAPFREVYERVRPTIPGLLSRSPEWWDFRRIGDFDKSAPPLFRVVLLLDGRPEGYAIYRHSERISVPGPLDTALTVSEVVGTSPRAEVMVWRYLCEIDLVRRIEAPLLHASHPLFHMVQSPRRLRLTVGDALWVRVVDAQAALAARAFPAEGAVTFRLDDPRCPWNEGVYRVAEGRAARVDAAPEMRLDAAALGSLYLGGVTARQLADAGAIDELLAGAVDRADALFRWPRAPWCPEIF